MGDYLTTLARTFLQVGEGNCQRLIRPVEWNCQKKGDLANPLVSPVRVGGPHSRT